VSVIRDCDKPRKRKWEVGIQSRGWGGTQERTIQRGKMARTIGIINSKRKKMEKKHGHYTEGGAVLFGRKRVGKRNGGSSLRLMRRNNCKGSRSPRQRAGMGDGMQRLTKPGPAGRGNREKDPRLTAFGVQRQRGRRKKNLRVSTGVWKQQLQKVGRHKERCKKKGAARPERG